MLRGRYESCRRDRLLPHGACLVPVAVGRNEGQQQMQELQPAMLRHAEQSRASLTLAVCKLKTVVRLLVSSSIYQRADVCHSVGSLSKPNALPSTNSSLQSWTTRLSASTFPCLVIKLFTGRFSCTFFIRAFLNSLSWECPESHRR